MAGIALAMLAGILIANDGIFVYTLDDPYIHLQFSRQLARGHFGLVPEEISSPSSSVLWPLLLAPLSDTGIHSLAPLLINIAASFASLALWRRAFRRFILQGHDTAMSHRTDALALAAMLTTNALALAFTGMEHPLQATATLAALLGAIELIETKRIRWWFVAGIVAGPLLRYENIPISATALAVMAVAGAWTWAAIAAAAIAAGLGAFAAVSLSQGLPPIPGSLQLKTAMGESVSGTLTVLAIAAARFISGALRAQWPLEGLPLIALLVLRPLLRRPRLGLARWLLLLGVAATMVLQMAFGAHFNLARHDSFSFTAGLLCCAYFYKDALSALAVRLKAWQLGLASFALLFTILPSATSSLWMSPFAAQDIYRQQWQMQRFLNTLGDEGVAVNDVGLVSYLGGRRLFDLVGLGSEEARRKHMANAMSPATVREMMAARNMNAVLVFQNWFQTELFAGMELVARFHLGRNPVTTASREVVLYGVDPATAARLRAKAIAFAPGMPRGTRLEIVPPPDKSLK